MSASPVLPYKAGIHHRPAFKIIKKKFDAPLNDKLAATHSRKEHWTSELSLPIFNTAAVEHKIEIFVKSSQMTNL